MAQPPAAAAVAASCQAAAVNNGMFAVKLAEWWRCNVAQNHSLSTVGVKHITRRRAAAQLMLASGWFNAARNGAVIMAKKAVISIHQTIGCRGGWRCASGSCAHRAVAGAA